MSGLRSQTQISSPNKKTQSPIDEHQALIQILKRYLHQNNLSLYCFQNQNNQTLLDVISDYFSMKKQQLHKLITVKFKEMTQTQTLPKRLTYVYGDAEILHEYENDPQLVSFFKITYELVCSIYEVRIVIYTLLQRSDKNYVLNAVIINPKGSQRQIQLAKVGNSFYRVQEQFNQKEQFTLPSLQSFPSAKSSNNLNSQQKEEKQFSEMREPFQSQKVIVNVELDQTNPRSQRVSPDYPSSSEKIDEEHKKIKGLKLKKGKSVNFMVADYVKNQSVVSEFGDDVSLGNILDIQQEKDLLKKCSNIGKQAVKGPQRVNLIHPNNHMPSNMVHPADMMYYYYIPQQGNFGGQAYPGKSQPYLHYAGHSVSPTKNPHKVTGMNVNNSPVKSVLPFSPIYPSQQSQDLISTTQPLSIQPTASQQPTLPPVEIKQGQRYIGRLKFFDQGKNYGFIIMEADQSDLFVHFDDLHKAGITKQKLKAYKQSQGYLQVKFSFKVMEYFGKYRQSRKAVQLIVIEEP